MIKFLLDAGVPDDVGLVLRRLSGEVIFHRDILPDGTPDDVVCLNALINDAVLVALDKDMKRAARRFGRKLQEDRFKCLNLLLFVCSPVQASKRLNNSMPLFDLEWQYSTEKAARRLWLEIGPHHIRTNR